MPSKKATKKPAARKPKRVSLELPGFTEQDLAPFTEAPTFVVTEAMFAPPPVEPYPEKFQRQMLEFEYEVQMDHRRALELGRLNKLHPKLVSAMLVDQARWIAQLENALREFGWSKPANA